MSYRNDHDAALSRIEALEQELAAAGGEDAKARFAALEGQLASARAALEGKARRKSGALAIWAGLAALVVAGGVGMASRHADLPALHPFEPQPMIDRPVATMTTGRLLACVEAIDRVVSEGTTSGSSCLDAIRAQASDPTLGVDVQGVLRAWLASETTFDPEVRAALVPQIKAFVLASFTR